MCYTSFQKYKGCRVFRQHYIYCDIQCEEMQMWSKLFKKEVWCRRIYEQGNQPFADEERRAGPPNFPAPRAGVEVPQRLVCRRCNSIRKESSTCFGHRKKRSSTESPKNMPVAIRRSLAVHASRTFNLISHAVPKAFAYNFLRICAKAKWYTK